MSTVKQELEYGIKILKENKINEAMLKSRIILSNVLNRSKEYLIIHEAEKLDENIITEYREYIDKLCDGIPVQYIINKQEFMGIEFYVNGNVLIPQPDTEILVEETIEIAKRENKKKILDLCTGSGAIGISIAKNMNECEITLLDISKSSLEVAKKNCIKHKVENRANIIQSDLFENIDDNTKFDIIVSNPPYIKTDVIKTLDKEVQNEPILALDGGKDGLDIYRRIINEAYKFLNTNGYLCLEIGYDQKDEVVKLIEQTGKYSEIYSKRDLACNDRIVICKKKEN